jgi:hypothetical protein
MRYSEKIAVKHEDLSAMVSAIEAIQGALGLLTSSLAGIVPENIPHENIEQIAANLLSACFAEIPYLIKVSKKTESSQMAGSETKELLLAIPSLAKALHETVNPDKIEVSLGSGKTEGEPYIDFILATMPDEKEKTAFHEKWLLHVAKNTPELNYNYYCSNNINYLRIQHV